MCLIPVHLGDFGSCTVRLPAATYAIVTLDDTRSTVAVGKNVSPSFARKRLLIGPGPCTFRRSRRVCKLGLTLQELLWIAWTGVKAVLRYTWRCAPRGCNAILRQTIPISLAGDPSACACDDPAPPSCTVTWSQSRVMSDGLSVCPS